MSGENHSSAKHRQCCNSQSACSERQFELVDVIATRKVNSLNLEAHSKCDLKMPTVFFFFVCLFASLLDFTNAYIPQCLRIAAIFYFFLDRIFLTRLWYPLTKPQLMWGFKLCIIIIFWHGRVSYFNIQHHKCQTKTTKFCLNINIMSPPHKHTPPPTVWALIS